MPTSTLKYVLTCAAVIVLVATLSACGGGGDGPETGSMQPDDGDMHMDTLVGEWIGDWPNGARTVLHVSAVSPDGQATGSYRHQEPGGAPFALNFSPDGPINALVENGVLHFSSGQSTFEFSQTSADSSLNFTFQFGPDFESVSVEMHRQVTSGDDNMMPGDGDTMMPEPEVEPDPQALANAIDLVANDSRQDDNGEHIGGWWWRVQRGAQNAAVVGTHSSGGDLSVIVSHDENGQLHHNISTLPIVPLQGANPWINAGQYINTQESSEELEGVIRFTRPISDHGLGSEWQVTELTSDYENAGTLRFYVATDVQPSDGSLDPYETATIEVDYSIELPGVPALPAGKDFMVVGISDGDSINGSLDGDAGSFSCANAQGCWFIADHSTTEGYYASSVGVSFSPDGGSAQPVTPALAGTVPSADYLAFGHWLYVPEDVTDMDAYDFGVFASGGDPFEATNLAALTGAATYEGDATGMYYVNGLSSRPDVGSFTAAVTLEADFGNGTATGFVSGEVNTFEFEGDVASSLPATLTLTPNATPYVYDDLFGVAQDSTNIFDTTQSGLQAPYPGGHIAGRTEANVDGVGWYGEWHGVFYGNGASEIDHPTSVAGTFNASTFDDYNRVGTGLIGSFGAHRQEQ